MRGRFEGKSQGAAKRAKRGKSVLKNPRMRYIPWSGLGLVLGLWGGVTLGERYDPTNYLLYGAGGMAIGLIVGYMLERMVKGQKVPEDNDYPRPPRRR